ncbi:MAG TPA: hypothetical protein VGN41_13090 [Streptosporangiaceae bacterium]
MAGVDDQKVAALFQRLGQDLQVRDRFLAPEPGRHVEVHQRVTAVQPGGNPDLTLRRGQRPIQPQLAQDGGDTQDEQRFGLVRTKAAQREPVAVEEPAAAARSGVGDDRHAGRP